RGREGAWPGLPPPRGEPSRQRGGMRKRRTVSARKASRTNRLRFFKSLLGGGGRVRYPLDLFIRLSVSFDSVSATLPRCKFKNTKTLRYPDAQRVHRVEC